MQHALCWLPCISASRMWGGRPPQGCLHGLWLPIATKTGGRRLKSRRKAFFFSHTSSPSYCHRVQIKSLNLGLIHEVPLGKGIWWRWKICGNTDSSFNLGFSYFTYTPASWTTLTHRHLWLRYTSESMTPLTQWNHRRNGKLELVTPVTK